jgi:hypothetical protein
MIHFSCHEYPGALQVNVTADNIWDFRTSHANLKIAANYIRHTIILTLCWHLFCQRQFCSQQQDQMKRRTAAAPSLMTVKKAFNKCYMVSFSIMQIQLWMIWSFSNIKTAIYNSMIVKWTKILQQVTKVTQTYIFADSTNKNPVGNGCSWSWHNWSNSSHCYYWMYATYICKKLNIFHVKY